MNKILHRDISVNNILLTFEEEGRRNRGLLIDYDYAFWYKDPEDANASASEHTSQSQEVLLHHTVSITITYQMCHQLTVDNEQGTLPFMSTELLLSQQPVEHSVKHDLESFFWVLLFVCTVYEAPSHKSEAIQDQFHPFGSWIQQLENIGTNEEGADTRLRAFGAFRSSLFTNPPEGSLFSKHIHPYFQPLTELVNQFAHVIFLVTKGRGKEVIIINQATGTYESVLDVLNHAFNNLPDVDPAPPSSSSPLSGLAFPLAPASLSKQKGKGEFKIPALPARSTRKSPQKSSTSDMFDPDQSLPDVNQAKSSGPSTPSKQKATNLYMGPAPRRSPRNRDKSGSSVGGGGESSMFAYGSNSGYSGISTLQKSPEPSTPSKRNATNLYMPRRSPRNRNKSGSSVGGDGESGTFAYGSDSNYGGISTSLASSHAGFRYGAEDMPTFSSEGIEDEDRIQRRGSGSSNKRTGEDRSTEETGKQPKHRRGF
jgi:hypothetical protein